MSSSSEGVCTGIPEGSIIPILLSSLSTTELCLMFLIERDRTGQIILYRSRNCVIVNNDYGAYCFACQELLDNLNHFHHLYLKKSCKQFSHEKIFDNGISFPKFQNVSLTLEKESSDDEGDGFVTNWGKNISDEVEEDDLLNNGSSFKVELSPSNISLDHENIKIEELAIEKDKESSDENNLSVNNDQDDMKVAERRERKEKAIEKKERKDKMKQKEKKERMERKQLNIEKPKFHTCDKCGEMFKNHLDKLRQHSSVCGFPAKVVEGKFVACPFCNSRVDHRAIYKHLLTFHAIEKDNEAFREIMERRAEKKKVCKECGKEYQHYQQYYKHLKMEHPTAIQNTHFCDTCGKGYTSASALKNHKNSNHKIEENLCVECDKVFQTKHRYVIHLSRYHRGDGGNCSYCGKHFKALTLLDKHVKLVHINDHKYKCNQCSKSFSENHRLTKHIKNIHEGLKPFCCETCTYKTDNTFNLNLHRGKMHQASDKITRLRLIEMIKNGEHPHCGIELLPLLQKPIDTDKEFLFFQNDN